MLDKSFVFFINDYDFLLSHRKNLIDLCSENAAAVHIIYFTKNHRVAPDKMKCNIFLHEIDINGDFNSIINFWKSLSQTKKILTKIDYDIIHAITIFPILILVILKGFGIIKVPTILAFSGMGSLFINLNLNMIKTIKRFFAFSVLRFMLTASHHHFIVQNSDDQNLLIEKFKVKPQDITKIAGSGIHLDLFKRHYYNELAPIKVYMISRIIKDKGVREYLEAARLVKERYPDVEFHLVGGVSKSNPSSFNSEEMSKIICDDAIIYHSHSTDVPSILTQVDLLVLPSYREGFPKILMEAAACGCAIVTTNVVGCRDAIVDGVTGLLVERGSVTSLVCVMSSLIEDREMLQKLGAAGHKHARLNFGIEHVTRAHEKLYCSLLSAIDNE